ncbi:MAG TPA: hypothetical protein VMF14_14715 [Solirubrobacteraceae bacterium]|nr:hypothetical protein [Solirubrobacteraceae bacterium]
MTASTPVPDLIDAVVGFRQWRLHGDRLHSPYRRVVWRHPDLAAHCALEGHGLNAIPDPQCTCGIYAYYDPCPRTASAGTRDLVAGAVVLWGAMELYGGGMRAAHCRIVALALPLSWGRKRAAAVAAASRLGVPIVPHRMLGAHAERHGAPIPASLRPRALAVHAGGRI